MEQLYEAAAPAHRAARVPYPGIPRGCAADQPLRLVSPASHGGSCSAHPLLAEGSRKAPILTVDGQGSADAGGDDTDAEEEGEQVEGAQVEGAQVEGAGDAQVGQTGDGNGDALNTEAREYTMGEDAVLEAVRNDAPVLQPQLVPNVDAEQVTEDPSIRASIDAVAAAKDAPLVHAVLAARKPLTAHARKALLKALAPDYQGISKLKNAGDFARELVKLCTADGDMPLTVWVSCARGLLAAAEAAAREEAGREQAAHDAQEAEKAVNNRPVRTTAWVYE